MLITNNFYKVAAGLFAFNIMSRLTARRPYVGGGGYYGDSSYYRRSYSSVSGAYCNNIEDFNGTVIGRFQCPLDEFPSDYKYCCGPTDYQYCCKFADE